MGQNVVGTPAPQPPRQPFAQPRTQLLAAAPKLSKKEALKSKQQEADWKHNENILRATGCMLAVSDESE